MVITMNHENNVRLVDALGNRVFLEMLQEDYPQLDLFKCSWDWVEDSSFICKAKGTRGDLIIQWA